VTKFAQELTESQKKEFAKTEMEEFKEAISQQTK
jgi:hypothetical protein